MDSVAINICPSRQRSIRKRADIIAGVKNVIREQGFSSAGMDAISERARSAVNLFLVGALPR